MPKSDELYPRKVPHLQFKILGLIALRGRLSQKEAATSLQCKAPTISEAFKIMINRTELINTAEPPDLKKQLNALRKRERFYKLSSQGLLTFIKQHPSPYEFLVAMIWYGFLNFKSAFNRDEFSRYYNLYIRGYIGEYNLRSCFFLGNLFENLFQGWRKELEHKCELPVPVLILQMQDMFEHDIDCIMQDRRSEETKMAYKVLECLLLNRRVTIKETIELTRLKEEAVREIIEEHSMTQTRYSQYIDDYESDYQSYNRSEGITIDLLNHLLIVPVKNKNEKEKNNEKYELSLLGVLLVLAIISLERRNEDTINFNHYKSDYYNTAASNYREKLPLIFEKWGLLARCDSICSTLGTSFSFSSYSTIFFFNRYSSLIVRASIAFMYSNKIFCCDFSLFLS